MKKVLIVFGTRPEAIKMCPLAKQLLAYPLDFDTKICVTGQHRQMLDQVLEVFEIHPDFDLDVMEDCQTLTDITTNIIRKIQTILIGWCPDLVLVHGDTATTFATSLACFYQKIKVGHVEAGLRTGDIYSPWPEEANRKLTSVLANLHFAPTETNAQNLINESINIKDIFVTGNTVIDALFFAKKKIQEDPILTDRMNLIFSSIDLSKKTILVTAHRRENLGEGIINICKALKEIAQERSEINIIYPVHLNPYVEGPVKKELSNIPNIFLMQPLEYLPFVYIMSKSYIILTDSGGIQEEAPSLGKPVLVMRDTTERQEGLDAGTVKLVGTEHSNIKKNVIELLDNSKQYIKIANIENPYGQGDSSKKIVELLKNIEI